MKNIKIAIVAVIFMCITASIMAKPDEIFAQNKSGVSFSEMAKNRPKNGKFLDKDGNLYIYKHGVVQIGWFRYKGHTYYGHENGTMKHPVGSLTRGQFRITKGNRWYAFDGKGRMITKNKYYRKGRFKRLRELGVRKNHTVAYVYGISAGTRGYRYSTAELRWQREITFGVWRTLESMQSIPDGWVDWQE